MDEREKEGANNLSSNILSEENLKHKTGSDLREVGGPDRLENRGCPEMETVVA